MYADGTFMYVSHEDINVIEKCLNDDLEPIAMRLDKNRMKQMYT